MKVGSAHSVGSVEAAGFAFGVEKLVVAGFGFVIAIGRVVTVSSGIG